MNETTLEIGRQLAPYWRLTFFLSLDLLLFGIIFLIKSNKKQRKK